MAWGHLEATEWLVVNTKVGIDDKDSNGWTALHVAVSESHYDIAKFLLAQGASPRILNNLGSSALDLAEDQVMRHLLSQGSSTQGLLLFPPL